MEPAKPAESETVARVPGVERLARRHNELRPLRRIVDEVYRLFDRRCRTETALRKLARLRRKAWRFKSVRRSLKKLWSPNLEKAA